MRIRARPDVILSVGGNRDGNRYSRQKIMEGILGVLQMILPSLSRVGMGRVVIGVEVEVGTDHDRD